MIDSAAPGLAARLRAGTQDLHLEAERSGLMAVLLQGRISRETYGHLLANLLAIYNALELGHDGQPPAPAWPWPLLRRAPALQQDLASLGLPQVPPLVPATQEYVARLQALAAAAASAPGEPASLWWAHAYVRYLGDLHGGQILRRRVALALGLAQGAGLAFYDFGPADQVARLIRQVRSSLDALPTEPAEVDRLVAEARWAFAQHVRLFQQLAH